MTSTSESPIQTQEKLTADKYTTLQLFRFIAALMVILVHSTFYASERLTIGSNLYHEGAHGVDLFFVISGFVMIVSSQKLFGTDDGWRIFSIKRLLRIVPIYWIVTTFKLLATLMSKSLVLHAKVDTWFIIKSYLFIPALNPDGLYMPLHGVGWTLNFEMFFYALFAVALAVKVRPMIMLSAVFVPLFILSFFKTPEWGAFGFYTDPIVLNFLFGMVAAQLVLSGKKLPLGLAIGVITVSLLYLFLPRVGYLHILGMSVYYKIIASFLAIYGAASIPVRLGDRIPLWLIYLGGASYSLYLIHHLVAPAGPFILNKLNIHITELSVLISVIAALIIGTVFYKFIEVPVTRLVSGLAKKLNLI